MEATLLCLKIIKPDLNTGWNEKISSLIKGLADLKDIQVIEEKESDGSQINISYNIQKVHFNKILKLVENTGAAVVEIKKHLLADRYVAVNADGTSNKGSAFAEVINKVEDTTGVAVSLKCIIKIILDPVFTNKNYLIETISNRI